MKLVRPMILDEHEGVLIRSLPVIGVLRWFFYVQCFYYAFSAFLFVQAFLQIAASSLLQQYIQYASNGRVTGRSMSEFYSSVSDLYIYMGGGSFGEQLERFFVMIFKAGVIFSLGVGYTKLSSMVRLRVLFVIVTLVLLFGFNSTMVESVRDRIANDEWITKQLADFPAGFPVMVSALYVAPILHALGAVTLFAYVALVECLTLYSLLFQKKKFRGALSDFGQRLTLGQSALRFLDFPQSLKYSDRPMMAFASLLIRPVLIAIGLFALAFLSTLPANAISLFSILASLVNTVRISSDPRYIVMIIAQLLIFLVGNVGSWILLIYGLHRLTRNSVRSASRYLLTTIERAQSTEKRPIVLFLRPFSVDAIPLLSNARRATWFWLVTFLFDFHNRHLALGQLAVEEFTKAGPVVSLGDPHDGLPLYGTARGYFDSSSWRRGVEKLCEDAGAIVICISDTNSVWWELSQIEQMRLSIKTLFLIDQRYRHPDANRAIISQSAARLPSFNFERDDVVGIVNGGDVMGWFTRADGTLVILKSSTFSRYAHTVAMREFLMTSALAELGSQGAP
jgi:hypothetical protein